MHRINVGTKLKPYGMLSHWSNETARILKREVINGEMKFYIAIEEKVGAWMTESQILKAFAIMED